jgi:hypothetical protein
MCATLAIYLVFCWVDRLGNWYQVIMPGYALLAVGLAAGVDWAERQRIEADKRITQRNQLHITDYALRFAVILVLIGLTVYRGALSFPRANSRNRAEDTGLAPGWAILADDPAPAMTVLGTVGETLALNYLTEIWGERPDVRTVTSDQARALLTQGRPLAVTEAALPLVPTEVSPDAHYSALGRTLVAVSAQPNRSAPATLQPWTHDFDPDLRLEGGLFSHNGATGEWVVLLVWQARSQPGEDWSVSVRLTQSGREIAQLDHQHPVAGAYPMTRWTAGEVVGDAYPFALPPDARPDGLTVILYRRTADGGFVNLDVGRFEIE